MRACSPSVAFDHFENTLRMLARQRARYQDGRVIDEEQFRAGVCNRVFHGLPLFARRAHQVPFVQCDHAGFSCFLNQCRDAAVLCLYPFGGINYQHTNVSARNRLFRPHYREDFNRAGMFAARTKPGGIDKEVVFALALELDIDGIPRSIGFTPSCPSTTKRMRSLSFIASSADARTSPVN